MKKLTLKMNRVYSWKGIDLSSTRKFYNFHQHHLFIKKLKTDVLPQNKERTILILAEYFEPYPSIIDLIPFKTILVLDVHFDGYHTLDIEDKKVIQIGLHQLILIQILQTMGIKIDAIFLPIINCAEADFLLEMIFPIISDEFFFITNRTSDNEYLLNYYEGKLANLPFDFAYKIEQDEFDHLYFYSLISKQAVTTILKMNGKKINVVHGSFWEKIDSDIEVVFTQFPDDWSEYIISLYENDIFSTDGKYKSSDNEVFNLKYIDAIDAMISKCGYESVGFTINPHVWNLVERIIKSENAVKEIFVYGFFNNPNKHIPTFIKEQIELM